MSFTHGTRSAYQKHKCRCDECRKWNTERARRRRATARVVTAQGVATGVVTESCNYPQAEDVTPLRLSMPSPPAEDVTPLRLRTNLPTYLLTTTQGSTAATDTTDREEVNSSSPKSLKAESTLTAEGLPSSTPLPPARPSVGPGGPPSVSLDTKSCPFSAAASTQFAADFSHSSCTPQPRTPIGINMANRPISHFELRQSCITMARADGLTFDSPEVQAWLLSEDTEDPWSMARTWVFEEYGDDIPLGIKDSMFEQFALETYRAPANTRHEFEKLVS